MIMQGFIIKRTKEPQGKPRQTSRESQRTNFRWRTLRKGFLNKVFFFFKTEQWIHKHMCGACKFLPCYFNHLFVSLSSYTASSLRARGTVWSTFIFSNTLGQMPGMFLVNVCWIPLLLMNLVIGEIPSRGHREQLTTDRVFWLYHLANTESFSYGK